MSLIYERSSVRLFCMDNLELLRSLPSESVDSLVVDPPAGIGFAGKLWDKPGTMGVLGGNAMPATTSTRNPSCRNCGGRKRAGEATKACACEEPDWNDLEYRLKDRQAFVSWLTEVMREALRVLKPGSHGFVWALPRTSHWTATALEDAGFEVREVFDHIFGSGFPKSLDVSKAIDKEAGAEREVVGTSSGPNNSRYTGERYSQKRETRFGTVQDQPHLTTPTTEAAQRWAGFGTATKPAKEHWILVRKPLSERNVALNVLKHGCGGLNVDGCRVGGFAPGEFERLNSRCDTPRQDFRGGKLHAGADCPTQLIPSGMKQEGRWPPNLLLSHSADCVPLGTRTVESNGHFPAKRGNGGTSTAGHTGQDALEERHTKGEEVVTWDCAPDCPVAEIDRQSGVLTSGTLAAGTQREGIGYRGGLGTTVRNTFQGNSGGASRFYPTFQYVAKPARSEKDAKGRVRNRHPTPKAVALMRWLIRLVTPPGGIVLDFFMGSGSTGVACVEEGFGFLGTDNDPESCETARIRIEAAQNTPKQGTLDFGCTT